jgi:hypothetical protein
MPLNPLKSKKAQSGVVSGRSFLAPRPQGASHAAGKRRRLHHGVDLTAALGDRVAVVFDNTTYSFHQWEEPRSDGSTFEALRMVGYSGGKAYTVIVACVKPAPGLRRSVGVVEKGTVIATIAPYPGGSVMAHSEVYAGEVSFGERVRRVRAANRAYADGGPVTAALGAISPFYVDLDCNDPPSPGRLSNDRGSETPRFVAVRFPPDVLQPVSTERHVTWCYADGKLGACAFDAAGPNGKRRALFIGPIAVARAPAAADVIAILSANARIARPLAKANVPSDIAANLAYLKDTV